MKAALMLGVNPKAKRESNDFYATDPWAITKMAQEWSKIGLEDRVFEPACGLGHLSDALTDLGYDVYSSDIVDYGYSEMAKRADFLRDDPPTSKFPYSIVTNPPFKLASEFIERANDILVDGGLSCFFLKIQFLETPKRAELFKKCGLKYVYVNSERVCCAKNGEFEKYFKKRNGHYVGGTQLYAWFIFQKGYSGEPVLRWI